MIRNFVVRLAGDKVSDSWVSRFLQRHQDTLLMRWSSGLDRARHRADLYHNYQLYFSLLCEKLGEYSIQPRHIYNMDEKGFSIGSLKKSRRLFSRSAWERDEVRQVLQDGDRTWITCLSCICADGTVLPPGLIYEGKQGMRSSWIDDLTPGEQDVHFATSESGWTDNELGRAWIEEVFDRYTRPKAEADGDDDRQTAWRLLILDGHASHVSEAFINYCDNNRILLCILPPHSTHRLQPLDKVFFARLSAHYDDQLAEFLMETQGLVPVNKCEFLSLFWRAWTATAKDKYVLSSFEVTGIQPVDPSRILDKFKADTLSEEPTHTARQQQQNPQSLPDWRVAERLLRTTVKDAASPEAKKLSIELHSLVTRVELLE